MRTVWTSRITKKDAIAKYNYHKTQLKELRGEDAPAFEVLENDMREQSYHDRWDKIIYLDDELSCSYAIADILVKKDNNVVAQFESGEDYEPIVFHALEFVEYKGQYVNLVLDDENEKVYAVAKWKDTLTGKLGEEKFELINSYGEDIYTPISKFLGEHIKL